MARELKTAYFMFGRFNPPTIGHGKAFEQLANDATRDHADTYVFVSSTQNNNKNPLTVEQKIYYLEKLYGDLGIRFINTTTCPLGSGKPCKSPFQAIPRLQEMGYKNLTMYVGSDREEDFASVTKYYPTIKVTTGKNGERTEGISATEVRKAARSGNALIVQKLTGLSEKNAKQLIEDIKKENAKRLHHTYSKASKSKASRRKASSRSRSPTRRKSRSRSRSRGGYNARTLKNK